MTTPRTRRGKNPERMVAAIVRRANLERQEPLCYCDTLLLPWMHHQRDHTPGIKAVQRLRAKRSNP